MWRATLDILDFLPLQQTITGGVIISDWYTDKSNKDQALKITVRFLSNTIQTNRYKSYMFIEKNAQLIKLVMWNYLNLELTRRKNCIDFKRSYHEEEKATKKIKINYGKT